MHSLSNIRSMCRVVIAVSRTVVSLNYGQELAEFKWIKRKLVHQIVVVEEIQTHVQQWVTCVMALNENDIVILSSTIII